MAADGGLTFWLDFRIFADYTAFISDEQVNCELFPDPNDAGGR